MEFLHAGILFMLIALTKSSPLPSDHPDVTTPSSQSAWTISEVSTQVKTETSASADSDFAFDEGNSEITDSDTDLHTRGEVCLQWMASTALEANRTFNKLCLEWCEDRVLTDVDDICASVVQDAQQISHVPTVQQALDVLGEKSVYTNLLAVYNLTLQYTYLVEVMFEIMPEYNESTVCSFVDQMTDPSLGNRRRYCRYIILYQALDPVLQQLAAMIKKLHGSIPRLQLVSARVPTDLSEREGVFMATVAAIGNELMKAHAVLETSVVDQFCT